MTSDWRKIDKIMERLTREAIWPQFALMPVQKRDARGRFTSEWESVPTLSYEKIEKVLEKVVESPCRVSSKGFITSQR